MAIALLSHEVSDLTLGKPALPWLPSSASVRQALLALKSGLASSEISVWSCPSGCSSPSFRHRQQQQKQNLHWHVEDEEEDDDEDVKLHSGECRCLGKICLQQVICYLASEKHLMNLASSLDAPLSVLLEYDQNTLVQHLNPEASLLEALEFISEGAQNLVIPITSSNGKFNNILSRSATMNKHFYGPKPKTLLSQSLVSSRHANCEYCWLTHEDVLRFLLGYIGTFSPMAMMSIQDLDIIQTDVLMVGIEEDASSTVDLIRQACLNSTAVAVVEASTEEPKLVGEISCSTFQSCDATTALALASLSVGEFLVYTQDCKNPPQELVDAIWNRLHLKLGSSKDDNDKLNRLTCPVPKLADLSQVLQELDMSEESSDDELGQDSSIGHRDKWHWGHFHSTARGVYVTKSRTGPIFCRPTSSLIAVIMQALAHREHYVWVTTEDDTLIGIVTFANILNLLSDQLSSLGN